MAAGALRTAGTRQDTWIIRCVLKNATGGTVNLGIWDKKTGGELDSDDIKYYPGGMVPPISLGGKKTTGNVTLQRLYDRHDDHDRIMSMLNAVGKGQMTISQKPMDPDGHEYGKAIQYVGTLKRVTVPETDSESTTAAMLEIEIGIAGYPVTM
jgi:hypothetical protein